MTTAHRRQVWRALRDYCSEHNINTVTIEEVNAKAHIVFPGQSAHSRDALRARLCRDRLLRRVAHGVYEVLR